MGVCKAYDTKVGTHLFLAQMAEGHPLRAKLEKLEFGTSTGRQRMVGWCDCVEKGEALRYGGFEDLVINKLDALTWSGDWMGGELLLCTGYRTPEGEVVHYLPREETRRAKLQPVYRQCPGWAEDVSEVRSFGDLPQAAQRYVAEMVHAILSVAYRGEDWPEELPNLRYIGVGPEPSQIIRDVPSTRELIALCPGS
jgi:adenylosuccinate synthase